MELRGMDENGTTWDGRVWNYMGWTRMELHGMEENDTTWDGREWNYMGWT